MSCVCVEIYYLYDVNRGWMSCSLLQLCFFFLHRSFTTNDEQKLLVPNKVIRKEEDDIKKTSTFTLLQLLYSTGHCLFTGKKWGRWICYKIRKVMLHVQPQNNREVNTNQPVTETLILLVTLSYTGRCFNCGVLFMKKKRDSSPEFWVEFWK